MKTQSTKERHVRATRSGGVPRGAARRLALAHVVASAGIAGTMLIGSLASSTRLRVYVADDVAQCAALRAGPLPRLNQENVARHGEAAVGIRVKAQVRLLCDDLVNRPSGDGLGNDARPVEQVRHRRRKRGRRLLLPGKGFPQGHVVGRNPGRQAVGLAAADFRGRHGVTRLNVVAHVHGLLAHAKGPLP